MVKYIKQFEGNEFDIFGEEDWEEFSDDAKVDYLSIYISYYSIIITENEIKDKMENYTYLNSPSEKDIPYDNDILLDGERKFKNKVFLNDTESKEWLIKINDREEIRNYKGFIEECVNKNLYEFFDKKGWEFELNGGFHIYPLDIEIDKKQFNNFIKKYFFKK